MTSFGHHSKTSPLNGSSEFIRHEACNNCGSSDGNSIYSDGHGYCFVCHTYTQGDEEPIHIHQTNRVQIKGSAERLQKRRISQQTCEKYKVYRDGNKLQFYYHDESGIVKGAKIKTKDKQFCYEGESTGTFFGQHLFPSTGKRVVITEGELDAVSCYEAMPGWPMVSLPSGAAAARKAIQRNLQWLQGYEEIVLFFDNDDAGRKATEEACQVLPPGKVKIANLLGDYKDASDAISANDSHSVCKAIWDAKPYRPDGIVDGKSLLELVTTPTPPSDHDYPFQGLQAKLHGIRYGELVTITSGSGQGKSSVCRDLAAHLLSKGERVGYLALEESNRRTALGLMSPIVGKALHMGEHNRSTLTEAYESTLANWNLFLFDGFGSFDPDIIYNRIEYLAAGLDTKVIFLDHLSILLSGLDGDERRMIDTTMTRLRSLVERTGIALFLVSHLKRTSSDQNHEEGARVTLGQLRGSAAIAQLSDAVIGLERDQQSGSKHSDTTVRVLKNRYSGETGVACRLNYDLSTCKFNETTETADFNPSTDF